LRPDEAEAASLPEDTPYIDLLDLNHLADKIAAAWPAGAAVTHKGKP
jgi:hypothetical protein